MMKRSLVYGLLAAIGVFAWMMLEFALGFHTTRAEVGRYSGLVGIVFPIAAILGAILAARRACGGGIGFREAFVQGLGVSVVSSFLGAVSTWLYFSVVNPAFLESPAAGGVTLGSQIVLTLVSGLILGAIISLVAAFFVRRAPSPSDVAT